MKKLLLVAVLLICSTIAYADTSLLVLPFKTLHTIQDDAWIGTVVAEIINRDLNRLDGATVLDCDFINDELSQAGLLSETQRWEPLNFRMPPPPLKSASCWKSTI